MQKTGNNSVIELWTIPDSILSYNWKQTLDYVTNLRRIPPVEHKIVRYIRVKANSNNFIQIREIQVFDENDVNVARNGTATFVPNTTYYHAGKNAVASIAIDGVIPNDTNWPDVAHTATAKTGNYFELDLKNKYYIKKIVLYNRVELSERMNGMSLILLDENKNELQNKTLNSDLIQTFDFKKSYRLLSQTEIKENQNILIKSGQDQWVAGYSHDSNGDLVQDWIQIGNRHHVYGKSHKFQTGGYPGWGNAKEKYGFKKYIAVKSEPIWQQRTEANKLNRISTAWYNLKFKTTEKQQQTLTNENFKIYKYVHSKINDVPLVQYNNSKLSSYLYEKQQNDYKPIYNTLKNVDVNFKIPNGTLYYGAITDRLKNEVLINPPVGQRKSSSYWSSEYNDSSLDSIWQWTVNKSYNIDGNPNNEWTEVDLLYVAKINGIITQGGPKGSGPEYIKTYIVKYSIDGNTFYDVDGGKIFNGNTDRNTKVTNRFSKYIEARYVRVYFKTFHRYASMRFGLLGTTNKYDGWRKENGAGAIVTSMETWNNLPKSNEQTDEQIINYSQNLNNLGINSMDFSNRIDLKNYPNLHINVELDIHNKSLAFYESNIESIINPPESQRSGTPNWTGRNYSMLDNNNYWAVQADDNKEQNPNNAWVGVDLLNTTKINGIVTQGNGLSQEYFTSFILKYSNDNVTFYDVDGGKIFDGNVDPNTHKKNYFNTPIRARYVRVYFKTFNNHASIRFALIGFVRQNYNMKIINPPESQRSGTPNWPGRNYSMLDNNNYWAVQATDNIQQNPNNAWVGVDLLNKTSIKGIITQGNGLSEERFTSFILKYSNDNITFYDVDGGKIFDGNVNKNSYKKNYFNTAIRARYVRVYFKTFDYHASMRFALIGTENPTTIFNIENRNNLYSIEYFNDDIVFNTNIIKSNRNKNSLVLSSKHILDNYQKIFIEMLASYDESQEIYKSLFVNIWGEKIIIGIKFHPPIF